MVGIKDRADGETRVLSLNREPGHPTSSTKGLSPAFEPMDVEEADGIAY